MVKKPTNTYKIKDYLTLYQMHSIPATCFGHTCGHHQGLRYKGYITEVF